MRGLYSNHISNGQITGEKKYHGHSERMAENGIKSHIKEEKKKKK